MTINGLAASTTQTSMLQSTINDAVAQTKAKSMLSQQDLDKIDTTSKDFEATFLTEMLKPMFEGIKANKMFGGGNGEDTYKDFMLQSYGKKMVDNGGIGIASHVKEQMIRIQEASGK